MKTACFKKYKGNVGISIALYAPDEWTGPSYPALAPARQLLTNIKRGLINEREYEEVYRREVLSNLDPSQVYNDLKDKVMLCWELPGEFCHRQIVAQWIEEELGIKVPEWHIDDDDPRKNTKSLF